jgi:N-acetylglucosaminyl-diphospho-decaprenol L-rhamnosyltransferase
VPAAVAVIVVSWNTRELLDACLASLLGDARAGRAEVFVVDNASTDGSAELVRERHPWAQLLENATNVGYGRAVNLAAERTSAAWIAASNSDLVFEPGALQALLDAGDRHPQAGSLAPALVLGDGRVQHSVHPFPTLGNTLLFNIGVAKLIPGLGDRLALEGHWRAERERDVDWAHGAFLCVRRAAWTAVGGFDTSQWMYAEDLDLAWRLAQAGWRTSYVPSARVRHAVSASTTQAFGEDRMERAVARTYAWMLLRRGLARTRATALVNVAGALARQAWLAPARRLAPARFALSAQRAHDQCLIHI